MTGENAHDFSRSGLGIGGLGTYQEPTTELTPAQVTRIEKRAAARRCRRCGETEYDGAMFTTNPGSGMCDDCYA